MFELFNFCVLQRIPHQVSHVITLLVSTTLSLLQSTTTRSTSWTARPSPRRHCTPRTTLARTTTKSYFVGKATLKNHSRTSIVRVAETCAQTLPQVMSQKSLRPKSLPQFPTMSSGRYFSIVRCTERIWTTRSTSSKY